MNFVARMKNYKRYLKTTKPTKIIVSYTIILLCSIYCSCFLYYGFRKLSYSLNPITLWRDHNQYGNAIYDVTVYSISDAPSITLLANRLWKAKTPEGQEDIVNHVAVVPLKTMVNELKNVGYDYICSIETDGTAKYYDF